MDQDLAEAMKQHHKELMRIKEQIDRALDLVEDLRAKRDKAVQNAYYWREQYEDALGQIERLKQEGKKDY